MAAAVVAGGARVREKAETVIQVSVVEIDKA